MKIKPVLPTTILGTYLILTLSPVNPIKLPVAATGNDTTFYVNDLEVGTDFFETDTYAVRIFYPNAEAAPYMNLYNKRTQTLLLDQVTIRENRGGDEATRMVSGEQDVSVEILAPLYSSQRQLKVTENNLQTLENEQRPPMAKTSTAFQTNHHAIRIFERENQSHFYINLFNKSENRLELDGVKVWRRRMPAPDDTIQYETLLLNGVRYVVRTNDYNHAPELAIIYAQAE